MENASKALLMAAGIFFAVLLISVITLVYSKVNLLKKTEMELAVQEQIQAFNAEYESYNRKLLRGIDVISVVNKAKSNNKKQEETEEEQGYVYIDVKYNGNTYNTETGEDILKTIKAGVFTCKEVIYDENDGRVNKMTFEEK